MLLLVMHLSLVLSPVRVLLPVNSNHALASGFKIHTYSKWTGTVRNVSVMRRGKAESCGRYYSFIINNDKVGN
ncbi:hypothetical protein FVEN_g13185 [Fusarium venenatum]|nr:hypothetical protein FVEN_g13185 [Fusarium venenatum]